jgi:hypothetical protein
MADFLLFKYKIMAGESPYAINEQGYAVSGKPTASYGNSFLEGQSTDWGSLWNTAWNQGYNNYGNSNNPYSGQSGGGYDVGSAYTQGQQQYLKDKNASAPPPSGGGAPPPVAPPSGGGTPQQQTGGNFMDYYKGWDTNQAQQDFNSVFGGDINKLMTARGVGSGGSSGPTPEQIEQERIRGELSGAWDNYFSNLDQQFNGLEGQAGNMNQIVDNNYNQGLSDINTEKANNLGDLATSSRKNEENQVKSLADIADNIRNLFRSGNIYLGARGAGDSSAANQYSYATAKLGSKQRGSVLEQTRSIENDIEDRKAKLNNLVTQEMGKIKTERDNNVLQTAQWLSSAQNELRQMRANGELQKGQSLAQLSQNLLDQARERLMTEDTRAKNRQDALQTWAMNNATTISQLKNNLSSIGQMNVASPTYDKLSGSPTIDSQGNMNTSFYGGAGSTTKEEKPSFFSQLPQNTWLK